MMTRMVIPDRRRWAATRHGQPGRVHFCHACPLQVKISSWVLLVLVPAGSSRHLPDSGLTRARVEELYLHCCAPVPLQAHNCTLVRSAVPLAATSRHLPNARRVPSPGTVHFCAAVPLHVKMSTWVPFAVCCWYTSTHLPATPDVTGPVGAGALVTTKSSLADTTVNVKDG